jgi:hypothetical protein
MARILESGAARLSELGSDQAEHCREDAYERSEETAADEQDGVLEGVDAAAEITDTVT